MAPVLSRADRGDPSLKGSGVLELLIAEPHHSPFPAEGPRPKFGHIHLVTDRGYRPLLQELLPQPLTQYLGLKLLSFVSLTPTGCPWPLYATVQGAKTYPYNLGTLISFQHPTSIGQQRPMSMATSQRLGEPCYWHESPLTCATQLCNVVGGTIISSSETFVC